MATQLNKPISRETAKRVNGRNVIVVLEPLGSESEARFYFRLKGKRTFYPLLLSDAWRYAALNYANREKAARKSARTNGIPWKRAKKDFARANSPLPTNPRIEVSGSADGEVAS